METDQVNADQSGCEDLNLELSLAHPSSSLLSIFRRAMIPQPEPSQLGPSQLGPSSTGPSLEPSPSSKKRRYQTRVNDESTSDNQKQVSTQDQKRRHREKADDTEIEPPYPWSTNRQAKIHTMEYLLSNDIMTITGEVQCNQCNENYEMEYDLVSKFEEVVSFIRRYGAVCHDRAPNLWMTPVLPNCRMCNTEKCIEPVIPEKLETINWLFLFLGQMLGCLKLEQLKHFCTQTNTHRTGAKNRLLYYTYMGLSKQLNPHTTHTT